MRLDKVQELIKLIFDDKEALDIIRTIYFQDTFPFIYNVWKSADVSSNFSDPGYDVDNFKAGVIVALEFQILSRNFKASNKVDTVKANLFQLLGIYLIDNPIHSTILTLNKC